MEEIKVADILVADITVVEAAGKHFGFGAIDS
jgi:hypothetical protein